MLIRKEEEKDLDDIRHINNTCINGDYESKLINNIRKRKSFILSLIAEDNGKIIGHIMYNRIKIDDSFSSDVCTYRISEDWHRYRMIKESLKYLKEMKEKSIIVLGHTAFYSRLGFEKAAEYGKEFLI